MTESTKHEKLSNGIALVSLVVALVAVYFSFASRSADDDREIRKRIIDLEHAVKEMVTKDEHAQQTKEFVLVTSFNEEIISLQKRIEGGEVIPAKSRSADTVESLDIGHKNCGWHDFPEKNSSATCPNGFYVRSVKRQYFSGSWAMTPQSIECCSFR
ncbi:hypothetical protein WKI13_13245 [Teredinibacter turnerae]|uniref:hypothetical protein n=1 Tax=Teredinibacter turnerae TaxID=2426 RepID=UPI00036D2867|nr:hypothetical protein [Teredinibacter turnerae]